MKAQKTEEINDFYYEYDEFDYSINNWGKIQNYIEEALTKIREAQSAEEINIIFENAKTNIDEVKTATEQKVELDAYKQTKLDELNEYFNSLNSKNYTESNWKKITDKVTEATETINKATNKVKIDTILTNTKTSISKIPTTTPSGNTGTKVGCRGSVYGSVFGITLLSFALVVVKKRKIRE